ncbi:hypothetical protein LN652_13890 [Nocardioides okcheonensis]|nr:hypothetical protein [Nocardioides okcheonensis]UFN43138.1 hypothetical protein LN652_13890 [Nocardioides okcheonensis]
MLGEPVGDDEVGVEERAQHQVREVGTGGDEQLARLDRRQLGDALADQQLQLGAQVVLEVGAGGEEELELEQVAHPLRLLPAHLELAAGRQVGAGLELADREQRELADRALDEDVDHGVAVERRDQVLVVADLPDRLGALVVRRQHPAAGQLGQRPADRRAVAQVGGAGDRPPARLHVGRERLDRLEHLVDGEGAVGAEQRQRHDRGDGDGGGAVEPVGDVERDPLDRLVPGDALRGELRHPLAQRERLADGEVGPPETVALQPREAYEPAPVLRRLAGPARLLGHQRDLVELVVDHGHRHDLHVRGVRPLDGVGEVLEDAVHRGTQLAGAGAAALDRPGQVALVGHHLADVGAQREPVDRDLLGRAADEDDAGALGDRAQHGEVQVGAAEGVGRREAPRHQHVGDDHAVEVRAVAERERQAVGPVDLAQPLHLVLVDEHVVGAQEPVAHPRPALRGAVVVVGRHLVEVAGDLVPHLGLGSALLVGPVPDGGLEALVVEELGHLLRRRGGEPLPDAAGQAGPREVSDTSDGGHGPSFLPRRGASTGVRRKLPASPTP